MPGIAICNSPILSSGSPPPWTPAAVPGCILYGGGYVESRATRATQPALVDGNMEAAGVAAWNLPENSALAKQGDPYAGLQCLRVTNAGGATRWAYQNVGGITGNRYRITGAARGDGTVHPRIGLGSSAYEWIGTTSNLWQPVSGDYNWTANAAIFLYAYGADTKYAEFDSLTLANLSIQSYTPAYTTIPGSVLAQATAHAQPWVSSDGLGIRYQGGDMLQWSAAASAVKCLHDGTGGTLIFAVRPVAFNVDNIVVATALVNVGSVGMCVRYSNANTVGITIMNGAGALDVNVSAAATIAAGNTYVIAARVAAGANGINVFVNGVSKVTATLTAPSAANPTAGLLLGAHAAGSGSSMDGILGHPAVYNRALSDAEIVQISNYILAQATL